VASSFIDIANYGLVIMYYPNQEFTVHLIP